MGQGSSHSSVGAALPCPISAPTPSLEELKQIDQELIESTTALATCYIDTFPPLAHKAQQLKQTLRGSCHA